MPRAFSRQLSAHSSRCYFCNFSAKRGEVTDKESRLFRRLRCEKVALRAAMTPAQSAKKRDQLSAVSDQPDIRNQR